MALKIFEETKNSISDYPTKKLAEGVLENIRKAHPPEAGWIEVDGYVKKKSNDRWIAVRKHYKVSD